MGTNFKCRNIMLHHSLFFYAADRKEFFDFEKKKVQGLPVGLTIDAEGHVWITTFGGGAVSEITHISVNLGLSNAILFNKKKKNWSDESKMNNLLNT